MDSILPSKKSCCQVYPNNLKNRDFGLAKAPGFDDHKWVNIRNMDPFMIVKSRELSLKPKTDFSGCLGIPLRGRMELVIASRNVHKMREFRAMLKGQPGLDLYSLLDFPVYIPPPETGSSFEENAVVKALHAAKA